MSPKTADCPGCGARLEFRGGGALLVVCEHCGMAVWRTDVALESIGKVAELAPIDSPIALRARGTLDGQRFEVAGVVQLDHGRGPWNEWSIRFEDGSTAWLAEAQGEYLVTRAVAAGALPAFDAAVPETEVDLGPHGRYLVVERGRGVVKTVRGELPERIEPGTERRYADLSGPAGGFGTLDYGAGEACEAVYVGRRHALADLAVDTSAAEARRERKVGARKLDCPKCKGAITLVDPDAERIGCPYCDALLEPDSERLRVVGVARILEATPKIPLGARGRFDGAEHEVLAFLVRSITYEGVRYAWDEYLLRRPDGSYRWLVCSELHWSLVGAVNPAEVVQKGSRATYRGETYRHFSGGKARVDLVLGEVYWKVEVGETVACADFVAPPHVLSIERAEDEMNVSAGRYVAVSEVVAAFGLKKPLLAPRGVGAFQPNPHPALARRLWIAYAAMLVLLLGLAALFTFTHGERLVLAEQWPLPPGVAAQGALLSKEFELGPSRGNARLTVRARGLPEGRFTCEGALVESSTERAIPFTLVARGQSEATLPDTPGECTFRFGSVPAGRYRVRLAPQAVPATANASVQVEMKHRVPHPGWAVIASLLLGIPPLLASLVGWGFENARWQKSDHA